MNFAGFKSTRSSAEVEVSLVGSFTRLFLPQDFESLFHNGVLVDPRNGTPMEMDAYSAYLAFKALERLGIGSHSAERKTLCETVIRRMRDCGGFWSHGAWTGSNREIHLRFTAAAIRLLTEGYNDGLLDDPSIIAHALKRHLSFSEPLTEGTWFLHDSLELTTAGIPNPLAPIAHRALGSSPRNCLALNTHLDTLSTLLYVLRHVEMPAPDRQYFISELEGGLAALKAALDLGQALSWRIFSHVDAAMREILFRTYSESSGPGALADWGRRKIQGIMHHLYFPARHRLRARLYGFSFSDGYLERDLALSGTSFEYHLVNVCDLVRFLTQVSESRLVYDPTLLGRCNSLIDAGIDYAIRSSYWRYLMDSTKQNARPILLCEAILGRLASKPDVPKHWIHAYCAIRRLLPPSAAILGYDPFSVADAEPRNGWDFIRLRNGREVAIDLESETLAFGDDEAASILTYDVD